jgi:hypothetical protein
MPDSKTILASRDQLGCVYECACGTIHLALGPVELKFTRESLLETFAMLRDAVEKLKLGSAEDASSERVAIDSSALRLN